MQESVALIAYIDETGIEPRHELLHLGDVDVAYREVGLTGLVLVFHQPFILEQGNGNLFWLDVDNYFTCHFSGLLILKRKGHTLWAYPLSKNCLA